MLNGMARHGERPRTFGVLDSPGGNHAPSFVVECQSTRRSALDAKGIRQRDHRSRLLGRAHKVRTVDVVVHPSSDPSQGLEDHKGSDSSDTEKHTKPAIPYAEILA